MSVPVENKEKPKSFWMDSIKVDENKAILMTSTPAVILGITVMLLSIFGLGYVL